MSRLSFAFATLGIFLAMSGCHFPAGEEPTLLPDPGVPVPSPVLDFIAVHYGGRPIESVRQEEVCDTPVYEVTLEPAAGPDVDLCFDLDWNFLFQATDIPDSALPAAVLSSIQSQFQGFTLVPGDAERFDFPDGQVQYEVSLADDQGAERSLVLRADGSLVCTDADDDSDYPGGGNNGPSPVVPATVLAFIQDNFPGFQMGEVYLDDLCDDTPVYEVALEPAAGPDVDLCFDLAWNFLFQATDIPDSALPAAVLSSIQSQFQGYTLVPGDAERFDFPDGQVQYEVSLAEQDETALEVLWYADGTVACLEQD